MMSLNEQLDIIKKGTEEIIPEDDLVTKLERSIKTNTPLVVKTGFDPTAPDIHIGNAVPIRKMKHFQDLGHEVVFMIGDFTGMIGDPSQKDATRKRLSRREILKNAQTYKEQVFKILDPRKTRVEFNSKWCRALKIEDMLELASKYTVARMIERDDFLERYQTGKPITILEFMYPLLQGYDSVALKADVELGGTDQKFNLLVAREIQREYGQEPEVFITMPLLVGLDGTLKMSKSLGNYIGITEPPEQIYGKTMSISDELIYRYFKIALGTETSEGELEDIERRLNDASLNPMDVKRELARQLVSLYYDKSAAQDAEREFNRVFKEQKLPENIPQHQVPEDSIWVVKLVKDLGFARTNTEARRLIKGGGLSIDGERISNPDADISFKGGEIVKAGKRRFARILKPNRTDK